MRSTKPGWLQRIRRQTHTGGDKFFVDYTGQTVPVVDADTGEIRQAQVFVAVLGASNYTYACATVSQKATDWVASIIGALEFIGGVPRLLVPDQPRALMARPDRYEPTAHRLLEELCAHYSLAVMPARPANGAQASQHGQALELPQPASASNRQTSVSSVQALLATLARFTDAVSRVCGSQQRPTPAQKAALNRGLRAHRQFASEGASEAARGGRCFIATHVFGEGPKTQVLRRFRDRFLRPTRTGRCLILVYFHLAPTVCLAMERWPMTQSAARAAIRPLVWVAKRLLADRGTSHVGR